ncbi:hypothetical protein DPMN_145606 [Dreissena polymorpha]|uniref:Uncharacterized protein n=1 Tax=Dreissena polymorpha TaxID=45954 RepID=A0A9D4F8R6_DREPO|nr:hypothetical protein DPMN_145606 [Dreissena polymorpha]
MEDVRCYIWSQKNTWDINLPQIAAAMRSAVGRNPVGVAHEDGEEIDLYTCPACRKG